MAGDGAELEAVWLGEAAPASEASMQAAGPAGLRARARSGAGAASTSSGAPPGVVGGVEGDYDEVVDFVPAPFAHDAAVAAVLVPGVAAALALGGATALGAAALGALATHVADLLALREVALAVAWLACAGVALYVALGSGLLYGAAAASGVVAAAAGAAVVVQIGLLSGAWATLQFRWLQRSHPRGVVALERVLFAGAPLACATCVAWLAVAAAGAEHAGLYVGLALANGYWRLAVPLKSSFSELAVLGPAESALNTVAMLLFPAATHCATHAGQLWRERPFGGAGGGAPEAWEAAVLLGGSALVVLAASLRGALDFLELSPAAMARLRAWGGVAATLLLVLGVEFRVIMVGYSHLVPLLPPWNYALVFAAMFLPAAPAAVHFLGRSLAWEPGYEPLGEVAVSFCLLGGAGAAALASGAPLWVTPFPLCAAAMLVQYYYTRLARDYAAFLALLGAFLAWVLNAYALPLGISGGSLGAPAVSALLFAVAMACAALPGLAYSGGERVAGGALVAAALSLGALEDALRAGDLSLPGLYPPWAVCATSAGGLLCARHLHARGCVRAGAAWAAGVAFGAKLVLLLLPAGGGATLAVGLVAACAAPGLAQATGGARAPAAETKAAGGRPRANGAHARAHLPDGQLSAGASAALAAALLAAVINARNVAFDVAVVAFGGERPSDALLVGVLIAGYCALATPLLGTPRTPRARGALLACGGAGALVALARPPLPEWLAGALWDAAHAPVSEATDAEFYRGEVAARVAWPTWLLVGAGAAGLWAAASVAATKGVGRTRGRGAAGAGASALVGSAAAGARMGRRADAAATVGAAAGFALAGYAAAEFFPPVAALQAGVTLGAGSLLACVALVQARTATAPALVPLLFCAGLCLLPLALVSAPRERAAYELAASLGAADAALVEGAEGNVLAVFAAACALLAFALKLAVGDARAAAAMSGGGAGARAHAGVAGGGALAAARRAAARALGARGARAASRALGSAWWMASVGNAAAGLSFVLAALLNTRGAPGGGAVAHANVFAMAPLLLMLNLDSALVPASGVRARAQRRSHATRGGAHAPLDLLRYFPVAAGVAGYLVAASLSAAAREVSGESVAAKGAMAAAVYGESAASPVLQAALEVLALACCAPNQFLLLRFLGVRAQTAGQALSRTRSPPSHALACAPLNALGLLLTALPSTRWLAAFGAVAGVAQFAVAREQRMRGLRAI